MLAVVDDHEDRPFGDRLDEIVDRGGAEFGRDRRRRRAGPNRRQIGGDQLPAVPRAALDERTDEVALADPARTGHGDDRRAVDEVRQTNQLVRPTEERRDHATTLPQPPHGRFRP